MTKAQEIEKLKRFIKEIGPDTYIGPWLAEVVEEVRRDISSDMMPTPTLAASRTTASRIITEAQAKADAIVRRANVMAEQIAASARSTEERVAVHLKTALRALGY